MSSFYGEQQRVLQDQFDSRGIADVLEAVIVQPEINDESAAFIESRTFFFLSTVNAHGHPTVSHKGGAAGFVQVVDRTTIVFPSYDGNGMFLSMGNIAGDGRIGLLFMDFERPHRIRAHAHATVSRDDPLMDHAVGAQLIIRVRAEAIFPNCPRYIPTFEFVEPSVYAPRAGIEPVEPAWKGFEIFADVVPPRQPTFRG